MSNHDSPFDTPDTDLVVVDPTPPARIRVDDTDTEGARMDLAPLVQMAQSIDRDEKRLLNRARWIGSLMGDSAYYRFPMGGKNVEGASIDLAEALAGEWGGMAHEMTILSAHALSSGGQRIHLRARAIDLKRIVVGVADAVVSTAPPPGKFSDNLEQSERWHAMQIQSAGSKIKRNAILDVIPAWFVDAALDAARNAADRSVLEKRGQDGRSIMRTVERASEDTVKGFATVALTESDLEGYVNRARALWTVNELRQLRDLWTDIKAGRATVAGVKHDNEQRGRKTDPPVRSRAPERPVLTKDLPDPMGQTHQRERVPVEANGAADDSPVGQADPSGDADDAKTGAVRDRLKKQVMDLEDRVGADRAKAVRERGNLPVAVPVASWKHGVGALEAHIIELQSELAKVDAEAEQVEKDARAANDRSQGRLDNW